MQKIYRFLILRAIANAVFEARDETSGATVSLYQWTPPIDDRDHVRQTLDDIEDKIEGEVFSADASLYLVGTSPTETAADLAKLRNAGLFTGRWLNEDAPPPPPPHRVVEDRDVPIIAPPILPPVPPPATRTPAPFWSGGKVFLIVFLFAAIAAWAAAGITGASDQTDIDRLKSNLTEQTNAASTFRDNASTAEERLKEYQQLKLLRFKNACNRNLSVAVRYQSYNGTWITQGWWVLKPGETSLLAVSHSPSFLVYARDGAGTYWNNKGGKNIEIVQSSFAYSGSAPSSLNGETPQSLDTMLLQSTTPSENAPYLDCSISKTP